MLRCIHLLSMYTSAQHCSTVCCVTASTRTEVHRSLLDLRVSTTDIVISWLSPEKTSRKPACVHCHLKWNSDAWNWPLSSCTVTRDLKGNLSPLLLIVINSAFWVFVLYPKVSLCLHRHLGVNTMNNMSPEVALHRISPELRPLLCSVVRNGRVGLDSTNCMRVTDLKTGWGAVISHQLSSSGKGVGQLQHAGWLNE